MSRWIVFDQPTADAVHSQSGIRPEIRTDADHPGAIIAMAVNARTAVAVVPSAEAGNVLLMRLRRPQPTKVPARIPANMAPAGFLGLSDSIDMDSEPEQPKTWWQKIIG